MITLSTIVEHALKRQATDVTLTAGEKPHLRINGTIQCIDQFPKLTKEVTQTMVATLLKGKPEGEKSWNNLFFAVKTPKCRLRVSISQTRLGPLINLRILPSSPLSLSEGHFPIEMANIIEKENGLVILCGKKGDGISTAVRSMLKSKIGGSILSIEDLIESPIQNDDCLLIQQEVSPDRNKLNLLKQAKQQRYDVISLSFERQHQLLLECLDASISSLVIMEMTAKNQLDALHQLDITVGDSLSAYRKILARNCRSLIHIQPIVSSSGERQPLVGIININETCRDLISDGLYEELEPMCRQEKTGPGSQNIDNILSKWVRDGQVDMEEALKRAWNPSSMKLRAKGIIHTE